MEPDPAMDVEAMRRAKDEAFRRDPASPIPPHARKAFAGLRYYPVDPAWRFRVRLAPREPPGRMTMQTSDGAVRHYAHVGHFEVMVGGTPVKVQAYDGGLGHGLFVPFRDRTSGKETYGAGRYLEADEVAPGEYDLDFNRAYNPFCAYDDAFSCPFPPPENWLPIEVRAGEKTYG